MKLHLPKALLLAVLAVSGVTQMSQAATGWSNNTFYVGGGLKEGELDSSSFTGFNFDGSITTIDVVDVTDKSGILAIWADTSITNALFGEFKVANGTTLNVSANSWGTDRYFDLLTIEKLTIADEGSANITVSGPAHKVSIGEISGSLGDVSVSNGELTLNATETSVTGKLYANGGNITLGDGTNSGILTVNRVELGDANNGGNSTFNIESGYTLKVIGTTNAIHNTVANQYKTNSFIVSEWGNSTTLNVKGLLMAENAAILTGDQGATINIENGGVLASKGLGRANTGRSTSSTINLKDGGKLILGDMGVDYDGYVSFNAMGGTIGIAADSVAVQEEINVSGDVIIDTTKYAYGENNLAQGTEAGTITLNNDITGTGSLSLVGEGKVVFGSISSSADIDAGTTNVAFNGSLTLGDNATFTAGSGTYEILSTDLSLYKTKGGIVDKDGVISTNGFMYGGLALIDGGTIENEFTVSFEGTDYIINNDNRTFGDKHIGYDIWYVNEGNSSLTDVYRQSQAGAQQDAMVALKEGSTLNVDTALNSRIDMAGNATLNISNGLSVSASQIDTNDNTVTLSGLGTYNISRGDAAKVAVANDWVGTVELFGQGSNASESVYASLDISSFGKAGSTISIKEYVGYFALDNTLTKNIDANLVLTNTDLAAIELLDGYSDGEYVFNGKIDGNGNFLVNKALNNNKQMTFKFTGDVSTWTGQLASCAGTHNFVFTGDSTVIKAQLIARNNATANFEFDHQKDVTVQSSITGQANNVIVKNTGTTTFTNSAISINSLNVEANTRAAFTGISNLTVTDLNLGASSVLTIGNGVAVADSGASAAMKATGAVTLAGGATVVGGLNLSEATGLTLNGLGSAPVTITGDLILGGEPISLSGDVLSALTGLSAGQTLNLFDVSGILSINGTDYDTIADNSYLLSDVFSADVITDSFYLGYQNNMVYAGLVVPEPATTSLSLLGLAALMMRRRRVK